MTFTAEEITENRETWIAALEGRGGRKYAQTKHALTNKFRSFCCLGVACEVVGPRYGLKRVPWQGYKFSSDDDAPAQTSLLPQELLGALGLCLDMSDLLVVLNDGDSYTDIDGKVRGYKSVKFDVIADTVRALPVAAHPGSTFDQAAFWEKHPQLAQRAGRHVLAS